MESYSTLFFSDAKKTIDFVLVYKSNVLNNESLSKLEYYLDNIERVGLYVEIEKFTVDPNTNFVKVHIPNEIATRYADIFGIDLTYQSAEPPGRVKVTFKFMMTALTRRDPNDPLYDRAPETMSGRIPKNVTSAERIMVVYEMLSRIKFDAKKGAYGINRLIREGIIQDAFPLHEGPHEWPDVGPLTDRQLLSTFWGSPKCWYKEQPLNVIEKYFGTELAFYFAWLGFYVKMLIPAAIMSVICVVYGLITIKTSENTRSKEICESSLLMCPKCQYKHCKYAKLSNSCINSYITYLFDNPGTIAFAVVISFWSTIFMELWGRQQAMLQLQWNVKYLEHDMSMRPEFAEAAIKTKVSPVTGLKEPYIPKQEKVARYAITTASVALMLVIMVLATFAVMVYRLTVSLILHRNTKETITTKNSQIIAATSGSFISVCFIIIFKVIYAKVALWLTDLENHRTQYHYDHSYIYKSYALAFTNNYSAVFYIAFMKGRFFTHPGDMSLWTNLGGISSDICDPTGCILDLSVQLTFIMVIKIFINNFLQLVMPLLLGCKNRMTHKVTYLSHMPCYEKDYLKASLDRYYLIEEYMDMVIQYGFVVFFVAGFPLAPFLALLNNLVELRVDAYKITNHFRRPIPKKVAGIGAWMGILQGITYLGVVTNAIVIAFTSDFVPKEIYKYQVDKCLRGFINTTISAFDRRELDPSSTVDNICYYPGKRYPPDHPDKYELTADYWFMLAMRFLVVVIFEHIVMFTNSIVAYAIPDVPAHVTEQLAMEEKKDKELRMAALDEKFDPNKRRNSILGLF